MGFRDIDRLGPLLAWRFDSALGYRHELVAAWIVAQARPFRARKKK